MGCWSLLGSGVNGQDGRCKFMTGGFYTDIKLRLPSNFGRTKETRPQPRTMVVHRKGRLAWHQTDKGTQPHQACSVIAGQSDAKDQEGFCFGRLLFGLDPMSKRELTSKLFDVEVDPSSQH
jgi:hypothetical protein